MGRQDSRSGVGGESTVNKEPELLGCDIFSNLPPFVRLECQV